MALVLAPMLPGGGTSDDAARVAAIASRAWTWRLGWAGWQITAASDVALAIALVRARFVPRAPAWISLALVACAVAPDQTAQALLVLRGPGLAARDPAAYLAFERDVFPLTSAWAACFYTVAAAAWSWCFAAAKTWSRALTILSAIAWPLFFVVSVGALVGLPPALVAAGNAVGFALLEIWIVLVLEAVLRRRRPAARAGALAPWTHPRRGLAGRALDAIANSRFARATLSVAPDLAFVSDIEDVVYVTWLVPADRLLPLVPDGLELQRVGARGDQALFTFLTYRHGRFAPRAVGPLRRFFLSPIQSNWRIHVRDPRTGLAGIAFVTNAVTSTAYALAARLLSDGMPMHVPARAWLSRADDVVVTLDPGAGSAPDCDVRLRRAASRTLPSAFAEAFGSYDAFLETVVPQDRAFSSQPWRGRVTRHEIDLGIPLDACVPLVGEVRSRAARAWTATEEIGEPVCFLVERVAFRLDAIERDPLA